YQSWHKMMPWEETHFLLIQAKSGKLDKALDEVESVLRRRRGVKPSEPRNFDLSTSERIIKQFDSITASVGLIAIAISSIGLLVGIGRIFGVWPPREASRLEPIESLRYE